MGVGFVIPTKAGIQLLLLSPCVGLPHGLFNSGVLPRPSLRSAVAEQADETLAES